MVNHLIFNLHAFLNYGVNISGFTLFLGLIIDRQHSHVKELRYVGKNLEVAKRMNEGYTANDQKAKD